MSSYIQLVQNDTLPALSLTLKDSNTGDPTNPDTWNPIDLSDVRTTINLHFRAVGSDTVIATLPFVKLDGGSTGKVVLQWTAPVMASPVGSYEGQIEIDFDGETQTIPEKLKFKINESFN